MNVEEVTIIVAMVVSITPVMWIAYLYYRLKINKLRLAFRQTERSETKSLTSETKPVLLSKKE